MLAPEMIEEAGEMVGKVYQELEGEMLDHMVSVMVNGLDLTQSTTTDILLLAQSQDATLRDMVAKYEDTIIDTVREACEKALSSSDLDDIARSGGSVKWPKQVEATITGVAEILARDNLQMVESAKSTFISASVEAVTEVNTGLYTADQAKRKAVQELEESGVTKITYRNPQTGKVTVTNNADVAVTRHIRTQLAEDAGRMTAERIEELDIDLVEVSSHEGARPSHAEWQGQIYAWNGPMEIDGVVYKDFELETGYGSVDGLCGVNCLHSFGPYRLGAPRAYSEDPETASGLPSDYVYELEQEQRAQERDIREAKREVNGAVALYEANPTTENLNYLQNRKELLAVEQAEMRELIDSANKQSKTGEDVLYRRYDNEWVYGYSRTNAAVK